MNTGNQRVFLGSPPLTFSDIWLLVKIVAVSAFRRPHTGQMLNKFIGMVTFYYWCINKKVGNIIQPFYEAPKGSLLTWSLTGATIQNHLTLQVVHSLSLCQSPDDSQEVQVQSARKGTLPRYPSFLIPSGGPWVYSIWSSQTLTFFPNCLHVTDKCNFTLPLQGHGGDVLIGPGRHSNSLRHSQ